MPDTLLDPGVILVNKTKIVCKADKNVQPD